MYNPLRYRGYVYDRETELYYLQFRYYNPTWGRFLNADVFISTGQGILGNNMFAYCGNNPVSRGDESGFGWRDFWEGVRDWLTEKKEEAAENDDGVGTIGLTLNGAFGIAGSGSLGLTFDAKGNIGLTETINVGGGFPSAGIGCFTTCSNAPNIFKQSGLGATVGASGGPWVVAGGLEGCFMFDTKEGKTYTGITASATLGLYPTVVEVHGEVGYTEVIGFNVFDPLISIANWMLDD